MNEPQTKLDPRFGEPGAQPTDWSDARRVLEGAEISWITTVRADGRPHVTPLVAVWLDDVCFFATGADEQKGVNLRANPNVVVSTGCNTWDRGLDVVVEGEAVRVSDDALLTRLADAWTRKWDGRWQFVVRDGAFQHDDGGVALVFSVRPAKVLAFGRGTFSHTSYRF